MRRSKSFIQDLDLSFHFLETFTTSSMKQLLADGK